MILTTLGLITALLLSAFFPTGVAAASGHPPISCDVEADSWLGVSSTGYVTLDVTVECASMFSSDHRDLKGTTRVSGYVEDGYMQSRLFFTLKDNSLSSFWEEDHPSMSCDGTLVYVPDQRGFESFDEYGAEFICHAQLTRHSSLYCGPWRLETGAFLGIEVDCQTLSRTTKRTWTRYQTDGTLLARVEGKKSGTVLIQVYDPQITQVIIKPDSLKGNPQYVLPVVNGIARFVPKTSRMNFGRIVLGTYEYDGYSDYVVSPYIFWGTRR
jgi:hypothetical protein